MSGCGVSWNYGGRGDSGAHGEGLNNLEQTEYPRPEVLALVTCYADLSAESVAEAFALGWTALLISLVFRAGPVKSRPEEDIPVLDVDEGGGGCLIAGAGYDHGFDGSGGFIEVN